MLAVDFAGTSAHAAVIEAIDFLKAAFAKQRPLGQYPADAVPTRFIPESIKRYIYVQDGADKGLLIPDRYEFLVFKHLRNGLEAATSFAAAPHASAVSKTTCSTTTDGRRKKS